MHEVSGGAGGDRAEWVQLSGKRQATSGKKRGESAPADRGGMSWWVADLGCGNCQNVGFGCQIGWKIGIGG